MRAAEYNSLVKGVIEFRGSLCSVELQSILGSIRDVTSNWARLVVMEGLIRRIVWSVRLMNFDKEVVY